MDYKKSELKMGLDISDSIDSEGKLLGWASKKKKREDMDLALPSELM